MKIALFGMRDEEITSFKEKLEELRAEFQYEEEIQLVCSLHPSEVSYLPLPLDNIAELHVAHEQRIARGCDVVVYADDDAWGNLKRLHLERLEREGILVGWTRESRDVVNQVVRSRPGLVPVAGGISSLATHVFYIIDQDKL